MPSFRLFRPFQAKLDSAYEPFREKFEPRQLQPGQAEADARHLLFKLRFCRRDNAGSHFVPPRRVAGITSRSAGAGDEALPPFMRFGGKRLCRGLGAVWRDVGYQMGLYTTHISARNAQRRMCGRCAVSTPAPSKADRGQAIKNARPSDLDRQTPPPSRALHPIPRQALSL